MNLLQAFVFSAVVFIAGYGTAYLVMTFGIKQDQD